MRKPLQRLGALLVLTVLAIATGVQAQGEPIRIGFLIPLTGPLATPGQDMRDGFALFWEQAGQTAGGRKVQVITADTIAFMRKLDVKEIHGYHAAQGIKLLKPSALGNRRASSM